MSVTVPADTDNPRSGSHDIIPEVEELVNGDDIKIIVKTSGRFLRTLMWLADHWTILWLVFCANILISSAGFAWFERKQEDLSTWIDPFYWAGVTSYTIGFGDLLPKSNGGKLFTVLWVAPTQALLIATLTASLISNILLDKNLWSDREQRGLFRVLGMICRKVQVICNVLVEIAVCLRDIQRMLKEQKGQADESSIKQETIDALKAPWTHQTQPPLNPPGHMAI